MIQIGREMRPMLNGSWKRPPANGRHGFTLRGFIIGLLIGVGIIAPAAALIVGTHPAYANRQRTSQRPLTTPPIADAAVAAPRRNPVQPAVVPAAAPRPARPATRTFTVQMRVTAYCPCRKCCGKFSDGKTASGKTIWENDGMFVAAPKWLPFGATVKVPGYHDARAVPVFDRGRAIVGYSLDLFFFDHNQARLWGTQYLDVEITVPQ